MGRAAQRNKQRLAPTSLADRSDTPDSHSSHDPAYYLPRVLPCVQQGAVGLQERSKAGAGGPWRLF